MKPCHVCQYICEDDAELCPICGADLTASPDLVETEEETEIIIENPEIVATANDIITAEIFCDKLKENGILFTTDESDLSSSMRMGFGGFNADISINIYVDKEDIEKAKEIYDNLPDISEFENFEESDEFEEYDEEN